MAATANVLKLNLEMFENVHGPVKFVMQKCQCYDVNDVVCKICLKYSQPPNTDHLADLYGAIVTGSLDKLEVKAAFHSTSMV